MDKIKLNSNLDKETNMNKTELASVKNEELVSFRPKSNESNAVQKPKKQVKVEVNNVDLQSDNDKDKSDGQDDSKEQIKEKKLPQHVSDLAIKFQKKWSQEKCKMVISEKTSQDPDLALAYFKLGEIMQQKGEYTTAIMNYENYIKK